MIPLDSLQRSNVPPSVLASQPVKTKVPFKLPTTSDVVQSAKALPVDLSAMPKPLNYVPATTQGGILDQKAKPSSLGLPVTAAGTLNYVPATTQGGILDQKAKPSSLGLPVTAAGTLNYVPATTQGGILDQKAKPSSLGLPVTAAGTLNHVPATTQGGILDQAQHDHPVDLPLQAGIRVAIEAINYLVTPPQQIISPALIKHYDGQT